MPARYFWRRLAALAADYLIASIIAMLALLPFANEDRTNIRFSPLIKMHTCNEVTSLPQVLHDAVAPYSIVAAKICRNYAYGVYNGLTVTIATHESVSQSGGVTSTTRLTTKLDIDRQGVPVTPLPLHAFASIILAILLAGVISGVWRGRSPGKKLFRVQVSGHAVTPRRVVLREALKWGPLLAVLALDFALTLTLRGRSALTDPLFIAIYVVLVLGLLAYYAAPLLRWRGAMVYDQVMGLRVDRGERDAEVDARTFE